MIDLMVSIDFVLRTCASSIFDLLSVVFIFFVIDLMVSIDFVLRTYAQSTVVKV